MNKRLSGIYGILPADLETEDLLARAERALKGGVRILQFRDKLIYSQGQDFKLAVKRARALRELTSSVNATLIVNDSVQMALDVEADGVHLGRGDMPNLMQLRQEIGDALIVGITCRGDAAFASHVLDSGADYVSFGAVFATKSKPEVPVIGLARLAKARQMFPDANLCAVGGITLDNLAEVKAAGPDCAAVISGLFATDNIEQTARRMTEIWEGC